MAFPLKEDKERLNRLVSGKDEIGSTKRRIDFKDDFLRKKSSLKSIRLFVDPISSLPLTKRLSLSLSSFKGNAINKKVCLMMSVQCL